MRYLFILRKRIAKLMVAICLFLLSSNAGLRANPIPVYPAGLGVSEFMFDSDGKWVIELGEFSVIVHSNGQWDTSLGNFNFDFSGIDSVCISSSTGSAKLNNLSLDDRIQSILIRNDSLNSNLAINQVGDYIKITTYYSEPQYYSGEPVSSFTNTFVFGNYQGATVRSPEIGESIVCLSEDIYSLNKTPTFGQFPKGGSGTHATVEFNIRYPDRQPYTAQYANLSDNNNQFIINLARQSDGFYYGEVYYHSYHIDKIRIANRDGSNYNNEYWTVRCYDFPKDWDTWNGVYFEYVDLDQFADIIPIQKEEGILKIYPNPIVGNSFNYETTLPVKSANSRIEITGLNGQKIGSYPVFENKGNIKLSSNIPRGVYMFCLIINEKHYVNTKVTVQ